MDCGQEMCPNWSGDGNVCPCTLFGIERPTVVDEHHVFSAQQMADTVTRTGADNPAIIYYGTTATE